MHSYSIICMENCQVCTLNCYVWLLKYACMVHLNEITAVMSSAFPPKNASGDLICDDCWGIRP